MATSGSASVGGGGFAVVAGAPQNPLNPALL